MPATIGQPVVSLVPVGVAPGKTGQFQFNYLDANGNAVNPPAGIIPQWVSSEPTAPVVAAADGLTASVTVDAKSTITNFLLTCGSLLADGKQLQATLTVPVAASGPVDPVTASITQTA